MKKNMFIAVMLAGSFAAASGLCVMAEEAVSESASESAAAAQDPMDTLVKDAGSYVTLPDLTAMEYDKYVSNLTDDDVDNELENRRYQFAEYTTVEDGAAADDIITMDFSYTLDGEEISEEDVDFDLGYENYGADFDAKLMGCKAGDTFDFDITYPEEDDFISEDWLGKTITFHVEVNDVNRLFIPEFTDEYVQENFDVESLDEYREVVKSELEASTALTNEQTTISQCIEKVIGESTFNGYPEDLYQKAVAEIKEQYSYFAEMYGVELDELYEMFGMDEESIEEDALYSVNVRILLSAIMQQEGFTITEDDLSAAAEKLYADYSYENAEDFRSDYEEELPFMTAQQMVGEYLLSIGTVTEIEASSYSEDLGYMEEETEEEVYEGLADEYFEIETEAQ